jgi:outer membrane protein assembly factor BamB
MMMNRFAHKSCRASVAALPPYVTTEVTPRQGRRVGRLRRAVAVSRQFGLLTLCLAGTFAVVGITAESETVLPDAGHAHASRHWPQWRGPLATGFAPHADPPLEWSETKNIRWKIELPGKGHSSPVVWGDRIFVTVAVPYGEALQAKYSGARGGHDEVPITHRQRFMVLAIDRRDGRVLWERTVREELPHQGGHRTASLASGSPVTDGEFLFAYFGSWGLYALDFDGKVVWQVDLGQLETLHGHGEGSSPVLYGDRLVVNWDHEGESFVVAFDKRTGRQLWKTPRERATSWTTPVVVGDGEGAQVVVSGSRWVRGYDLGTGRMIWECDGLSVENVASSPVAGHGMIFTGSTYDRPGMLAVRIAGAEGDITGTGQVVWRRRQGAPYVPTPLLYGDFLYFHYHYQSLLTRVNALTGDNQPGPIRLEGIYNVFSSPVAAAGRVYVTSREGDTVVLKHGGEPEVLATNHLDDSFSASAALVDNLLILRGERFLYCIEEQRAATAAADR